MSSLLSDRNTQVLAKIVRHLITRRAWMSTKVSKCRHMLSAHLQTHFANRVVMQRQLLYYCGIVLHAPVSEVVTYARTRLILAA